MEKLRSLKHKVYCNIKQNLVKEFTLISAKVYSEPFQTSKIEFFFFEKSYWILCVICFCKKLHLKYLIGFWIQVCSVNHKNNQIILGKIKPHGNFNVSYISITNQWKTSETTLTKFYSPSMNDGKLYYWLKQKKVS